MKSLNSFSPLLFFKIILCIFILGYARSSRAAWAFLQLLQVGATLCCGARAFHCSGFSCHGARSSLITQLVRICLQCRSSWFDSWVVSIPGSGDSWVRRFPGEGIGYPLQCSWASLVARLIKNLPTMQETCVQSLGWDNPLEKRKATHFSILAWRSSWGHKESDLTE